MRNPPRPGNEPMSPCKGRQIHFISIALPGKSNLFLLCDESLKQLSLSTCPFYILRPFSELWHKTVIFLFSTCLISYFSCWVFPADLRALTAFPSPKLNRHGISSTLCMVLTQDSICHLPFLQYLIVCFFSCKCSLSQSLLKSDVVSALSQMLWLNNKKTHHFCLGRAHSLKNKGNM